MRLTEIKKVYINSSMADDVFSLPANILINIDSIKDECRCHEVLPFWFQKPDCSKECEMACSLAKWLSPVNSQ